MKQLLTLSTMIAALAAPVTGHATAGTEVARTVYFSAVDAQGAPVTDLTPADLAVKENGKDRVISTVGPAAGPMHVSILVDDGGTGGFQAAVAQFIEAMQGHAQFAVSALNPQPSRLTDFTEDVAALKGAINGIGPRGRVTTAGDQIIEAVADAAKDLKQRKAARPAIVVLTVGG